MSVEFVDRVVRVTKVATCMGVALAVMGRAIAYGNENEYVGWTPYVMSVIFGIVFTFTGVALASKSELDNDDDQRAAGEAAAV